MRLSDLSEEQRGEVEAIVRETFEIAHARLSQGRSSMPIDIDAALCLAAIATAALAPTPTNAGGDETDEREGVRGE